LTAFLFGETMNEYFAKLSESLTQIDVMIESLESLPITTEIKKDSIQRLENAWIELFAVYDSLTEIQENITDNFIQN
jgi:hypothetical protein